MLRNVYLEGELGERYGKHRKINADNFIEIVDCLSSNFDDFRSYLTECYDKNIYFAWKINDKTVENAEELYLPLEEGDIVVTPVPAGEGKLGDALKVVAGVLIAIFAGPVAGAFGVTSKLGVGLFKMAGTQLMNNSVQKLLAEDPSGDTSQDPTYLFTGSDQAISSTDPVPICYGRVRVPGRSVSFEVRTEDDVQYSS